MARKTRTETELLDGIESVGDRLAQWVGQNSKLVLAVGGSVLLAAASLGGYASWDRSRENRAATRLGEVSQAYLSSMGGNAESLELVEPANPETARQLREEGAARFLEVAQEHPGTQAAVLARLEAGALRAHLGEPEAAITLYQEALSGAPSGSPLRAVALVRLARAREGGGEWREAAAAFEEAGGIDAYPLRYQALADATRCLAEAGDGAAAVALYERVELEAPDLRLPPHLKSRLEELRARARMGG